MLKSFIILGISFLAFLGRVALIATHSTNAPVLSIFNSFAAICLIYLMIFVNRRTNGGLKRFFIIAGVACIIFNFGLGFSSPLGEGFKVANSIFAALGILGFAALIYLLNQLKLTEPEDK